MGVEMRGGGEWLVHEATLQDFPFPISPSHPHTLFDISSCQNSPLTDDQGTTQAHRPPPSAKSVWEQVGGEVHQIPVSSADGPPPPHTGHFIFECKSTRPYVSRPSRTQQLAKVNPLDKLKLEGRPSVDVPDEFKTKYVFKTLTYHSHVLTLFAPNQNRDGQQVTRSQGERTREGQARRIVHKREARKEA